MPQETASHLLLTFVIHIKLCFIFSYFLYNFQIIMVLPNNTLCLNDEKLLYFIYFLLLYLI